MIKQVTDYLQLMDRTRKHNIHNMIWNSLDVIANMNIFVAFGAVAVYYASCTLQGISFSLPGAVLSFLYFLSMYLWNSLASIESTQHHGLSRYNFYQLHKKSLLLLSGISILSLLVMSLLISPILFYLMFFACFAGSVYHLTIVPAKFRSILHYKNSKIFLPPGIFCGHCLGNGFDFHPTGIEWKHPIAASIYCHLYLDFHTGFFPFSDL